MKKILFIFICSFGINLVWENLHSLLYEHYKRGPITELILIRAALVDALIILVLISLVRSNRLLKRRPWLIILFGILTAVAIEKFALSAGRWEYKDIMPIIPVLNTGLTPTIQLAFSAFLVYSLAYKKIRKKFDIALPS